MLEEVGRAGQGIKKEDGRVQSCQTLPKELWGLKPGLSFNHVFHTGPKDNIQDPCSLDPRVKTRGSPETMVCISVVLPEPLSLRLLYARDCQSLWEGAAKAKHSGRGANTLEASQKA